MKKVHIVVEFDIKADVEDDDSVRTAIFDKLMEEIESETLIYTVVDEDDEDFDA